MTDLTALAARAESGMADALELTKRHLALASRILHDGGHRDQAHQLIEAAREQVAKADMLRKMYPRTTEGAR